MGVFIMYDSNCIGRILSTSSPQAIANICGSEKYESIRGQIRFYDLGQGTLVAVSIEGIPMESASCCQRVLGFHIHEGFRCSGNSEDPFADARTHFNPTNCPHPLHAGDLPPLFVNNGMAWYAMITTRFSVSDVLGLTVIVHSDPDDFHTQPSGNSGKKNCLRRDHKHKRNCLRLKRGSPFCTDSFYFFILTFFTLLHFPYTFFPFANLYALTRTK